LMHKGSLLRLLDLKPEKELQFSYHRHIKLFAHVLCKPRNQRVRRAVKDNIIHVWIIRKSSPCLRWKRVLSTLPISNPLLNKNPLNLPYDTLGACFSPYNVFLSLYTRWGNSTLLNPGGYLT
jgi:hypothetical protein